jgi:hypothetical protein
MKTYAEIAARVGASEALVRAVAGELGFDRHAVRPRRTFPRGEEHPGAKLSLGNVRTIRRLLSAEHWLVKDVAARFGVTRRTIRSIRDRKTWRHVD